MLFVHFGARLRSPLQIYGFTALQNLTRQLDKPCQTYIRNFQLEYHRRTFDNLFAFVYYFGWYCWATAHNDTFEACFLVNPVSRVSRTLVLYIYTDVV